MTPRKRVSSWRRPLPANYIWLTVVRVQRRPPPFPLSMLSIFTSVCMCKHYLCLCHIIQSINSSISYLLSPVFFNINVLLRCPANLTCRVILIILPWASEKWYYHTIFHSPSVPDDLETSYFREIKVSTPAQLVGNSAFLRVCVCVFACASDIFHFHQKSPALLLSFFSSCFLLLLKCKPFHWVHHNRTRMDLFVSHDK